MGAAMARLENLIESVGDPKLRDALLEEAARLKTGVDFGLVYERHLPETLSLAVNGGLRINDSVRRLDRDDGHNLRVRGLANGAATVLAGDGTSETVPLRDLVVVRDFQDPIYPTLTALGSVQRSETRAPHCVINGENFHALQLLLYTSEGSIDCIYLDPPYNTGATEWKYNNDYVDASDGFRHSKWLSYMEKRLRLAKRLLKPDGVLIVTIDENEVNHLGVLLEQLFPEAHRQMVTICIQPSGAGGQGLSRVDEYAFFCFMGESEPVPVTDDLLTTALEPESGTDKAIGGQLKWESLLRRGNAWYRARRENLCYPIILDESGTRIESVGVPFEGEEDARPREINGKPVAWPVRKDKRLGIWRVDGARLVWLAERGYVWVGDYDASRETWALKYLMAGMVDAIDAGVVEVTGTGDRGQVEGRLLAHELRTAKTMWHRGRHNAGGSGGTQMLTALFGETDRFSYPKSLYAVRDCIRVAVGNRPDAQILDFFAGSGTTLHATALLNATDDGNRRCILVTNNEMDRETAKRLAGRGLQPGDPDWEAQGIFQHVCRPRCEAALTGKQPGGAPVPGTYLDGGTCAEGFAENCEFFRLDYLNPDDVALGDCFDRVLPLLWMAAGAAAELPRFRGQTGVFAPENAPFAVVFGESHYRDLAASLEARPDIGQIWLLADSDRALADLRSSLSPDVRVSLLYSDYLRWFSSYTARYG
jgi:adenine-specific DNA-methyltransferase